jgi:hypothetical protein
MTDSNPGAWDGRPLNPERDGVHWLNLAGDVIAAQWWAADALWTWGDRQWTPSVASAARWFYLGPCQTPAEVAAQVEAARRDEREACAQAIECGCEQADAVRAAVAHCGSNSGARWRLCGEALCGAIEADEIRARGDAIPGEYQSEAERERVELLNRLGRVTEELGLPMDATAGRIIEVIRKRVDDEREACASLSVRVEVPPGAETWSPLEAWQEALVMLDAAFREAILARGDA